MKLPQKRVVQRQSRSPLIKSKRKYETNILKEKIVVCHENILIIIH